MTIQVVPLPALFFATVWRAANQFFLFLSRSPPAAGCLGKPSLAHFALLGGIVGFMACDIWLLCPPPAKLVRSAAHKRLVAIVKGYPDLWIGLWLAKFGVAAFGRSSKPNAAEVRRMRTGTLGVATEGTKKRRSK